MNEVSRQYNFECKCQKILEKYTKIVKSFLLCTYTKYIIYKQPIYSCSTMSLY